MPPTVTGATMPILTNPLAARLAKKILPQSVFRSLNALIKIKVVVLHPTPDQGELLVLSKTSMLNSQLDIPISRSKRPWTFALGCSKTPQRS